MSKYIKLDDAIGIITEHQGIRGDTFKALHNAYAVDIESKRGEWVESGFEEIKCSVCGSAWDYCDNDCERFNFCPSCGARMKGADDE